VTTPILLMLLMVWLRTEFTPEDISSVNLLGLSHPLYVLETNGDILDPLSTTMNLEEFFSYNEYYDIFGQGYDVLYDYQSPAYFYPSNCGSESSFVKGEIPSSIIAFVGQNSTVAIKVQSYLKTLFKSQSSLGGAGLDPTYIWYETQEQLFAYIASETYLNHDVGVCFGFEIF
jgi:hypothetical protein